MYTIKQASIRTGVTIPLLRAWERRYGIPTPARTSSGYRLYDELALARVRQMRALVSSGWSPSQAARAVLEGTAGGESSGDGHLPDASESGATAGPNEPASLAGTPLAGTPLAGTAVPIERFVGAAEALDDATLDETLADAFAALGPDDAVTRFALPALVAVGDAWAEGRLDVASEHAASSAVMRRLGALYEAAGQASPEAQVIVGLPPRARHEAGALAFAVACRRAGLRVVYLGADVPVASWSAVVRAQPRATIVLAAVTADEARSAAEVARALRRDHPDLLIAVGGASAASTVSAAGSPDRDGVFVLPAGLKAAVAALKERLAR